MNLHFLRVGPTEVPGRRDGAERDSGRPGHHLPHLHSPLHQACRRLHRLQAGYSLGR